ncbi:site-specific integrase [[Clostridium] innocuum]|nr:site-specific integrase [[Clostridium] innocuum]MCR0579004.1 site-specific integrase [[Clostridium] innocuum]
MKKAVLDMNIMGKYRKYLYGEERSEATISKYMRDIKHFYEYLPENKIITKENLIAYKQSLSDAYKVTSINSMLVSINGLLSFMKLDTLKLKLHKVQRKVFSSEDSELSKAEYKRLLDAAMKNNNKRLFMLIQTICGTGIRVSEHKYITVESLKAGQAMVNNKGKSRTIFINKKLKRMLLTYCKEENIASGPIFITKSGKPMDRSNIWSAMKKLCVDAKVDRKKVFPHNLRHLFALTYYGLYKDVVRLADILGHTSIETTRVYTITSGQECQKSLMKMDLVQSY